MSNRFHSAFRIPMSALCGFLNLDSAPADPQLVAAQLVRLKHLGPDGSGTFTDGPVALGHVLLSITPESAGEISPWRGADGQRVIAFDGRLDHREDLCAALGVPAAERSVPDPELILRAHAQWGTECAAHLEGEFAFALWDGRRRELCCASDVFGRREFYYHCDGRRFTFGSRIRAVLAVPGVPRRLDELTLGCDLALLPRPGDGTLYAEIHRLPGARWLTVRPGGEPQMRTYWQLTMAPTLRLDSPEEYAEALRDLLERAVRSALRSRHPVAVMLSGGLDSAGLCGLAARALAGRGERLATLSNILPENASGVDWSREESAYIQQVLAMHPNLDPRWARGERFPVLEFNDAQFAWQDEPDSDSFSYRTRELAWLAEEHGARVVIGGAAGDMAASYRGAGLLEQLTRSGRWRDLARQIRLQSRARGLTMRAILRGEVLRPLMPGWLRRWNDRVRNPRVIAEELSAIHPAFAARLPLGDWDPARSFDRGTAMDHRRAHVALVNAGRLEVTAGLNYRVGPHAESPQPLTDRRLWEWCYRVPLGEFVRDGLPRSLYRRAVHDLLPPAVSLRTSKGWFAPDFPKRLAATLGAMEAFLAAHPASAPVWTYVHRPAVEHTMQVLVQSRSGHLDKRYLAVLCRGLRLAHFITWFHRQGA